MIRFISLLIISLLSASLYSQTTPRCSHHTTVHKSTTSDSMDVLHYSVNLDIVYLSKKTISGYTDLLITAKQNGLNSLKLDLYKLNVDSLEIDGQLQPNWNYNDTLLDIPLFNSLNIGDTILCKVYYHGAPVKDPSGWGGFYFSNDSTFAFNMGVGMKDNPHNYGRIWFPCIDDFVDRATYDFSITVKNGNVAICNGTLQSFSDGTVEDVYKWELHNDIPTYLASVAIGPYVAVRDTFNGMNGAIPIAIYVTSSMVGQAQASFINLKQILTAFELYYGPYRWERVGYVGVPFASGAMEHATSISIGMGYVNGTLTYESLFAHELAHHWFGDLVTCSSAPDMWLNEGWAVFSESMYMELVYGKEAYKNNMRELLFDVLKNTHINDNGYLPVSGVPHDYTYGSTVYDKGGTVAHSVRGYLGDDKFFPMLHAYMSQNSFSDQSSIDFRDFISSNTGINMNGFFDAWVFEAGFTHFAIDSFNIKTTQAPYVVEVAMQQRLNNKPNFAQNNRVPITFMDDNWNRVDTTFIFSGQHGVQSFNLNFEPTTVFCDLDEKLADATTDYSTVIETTGLIDYPLSYFKLDVKSINDSALFQITHNWVKPDTLGITYPGLRISSRRYWTINGINNMPHSSTGSFRYYKSPDMDSDIIKSMNDSLVILYRPHAGIPWQRVGFSKVGNWVVGYLEVDNVKNGEYVLAVYDYNFLDIDGAFKKRSNLKLKISPNPSIDTFHFELNQDIPSYIRIYNVIGMQVDEVEMVNYKNKSEAYWTPKNQPPGQYIIVLYDYKNTPLYKTSIIISSK